MEDLKRALVISVLARGWTAALGLLAVPFYLRHLGVEAYGIVGFFASLQALVSFLDLGMGTALIRKLAQANSTGIDRPKARNVTRTFELAYSTIALIIGVLGVVSAHFFSTHWVNIERLGPEEVTLSLMIASVSLACQWPSNLYTSGLSGIHRQVLLGLATVGFSTLRVLLTILFILLHPSLVSFFVAQLISAAIQTLGLRVLLWHQISLSGHSPLPKLSILLDSVSFAAGMTAISITSLILTQTDKLILSKTLSLSDFGTYFLAASLAMSLYLIVSPLFQIIFPTLTRLVEHGSKSQIVEFFHKSSESIAILAIPLAITIAVFSEKVLFTWTNNVELSKEAAPILALLILGNASNGVMNTPFALQLSHGWTKLALQVNFLAIVFLTPAIVVSVHYWGAVGGAGVWCLLQIFILGLVPSITHRRLMPKELWTWYKNSLFVPLLCSGFVSLVFKYFTPSSDSAGLSFLYIFTCWLTATIFTALALPNARVLFFRTFGILKIPNR